MCQNINKTNIDQYHERIHWVVDYISEHINEEITLDTLASVACFSPFHFHRIFCSMLGETPHDYIERIKLERAANKLCLMPNKPVSEIAFEYGFTSNSTFSRSFKKHYKLSPTQFIKQHIHDFHSLNVPVNNVFPTLDVIDVNSIVIIQLPEFHVAYTQTLIGYSTGIPKSWKKILQFATTHELLNSDTQYIGIPFDNPGITPQMKCRYRACITVHDNVKLTKGDIKTTNIQTGKYAKFHFKGKRAHISAAYAFIYGLWLPQSGYIPDEKPTLEIYPPELHTKYQSDLLEYDIVLPVSPL